MPITTIPYKTITRRKGFRLLRVSSQGAAHSLYYATLKLGLKSQYRKGKLSTNWYIKIWS